MIEINALDILDKRQVDVIPPHFSKMKVSEGDIYYENIENWIRSKLNGRFFIKRYPNLNNDGRVKSSTFVGFEIESEMTYFILACPYLRRN